jgi:hypothetical protein
MPQISPLPPDQEAFERDAVWATALQSVRDAGYSGDLLPSLTYITTTRDIDTPQGVLPAGGQGTSVSDYNHGGVYLIEFEVRWHVIQLGLYDVQRSGTGRNRHPGAKFR